MLSIDKFLGYLRSELNRSQRTVENYREDLKLFEQYARNLSESFTWESVDSDMIRNWMEHMIDAGKEFGFIWVLFGFAVQFSQTGVLFHKVLHGLWRTAFLMQGRTISMYAGRI